MTRSLRLVGWDGRDCVVNFKAIVTVSLLLGLTSCILTFMIYPQANIVFQNQSLYTNVHVNISESKDSLSPIHSPTLLPILPPTKALNQGNMLSHSTSVNTSRSSLTMPSKPTICIENPLIFGISNYGGIEMTTNWIHSLLQNDFDGRILLVTTDYKAYKYFQTLHNNTHSNASISFHLYCWQCANNSSWNKEFNAFVCQRPVITLWIVQQMQNKSHYLSAFDSLMYMDGDMVIMKPFADWMDDVLSSRYCDYQMVVMDDTNGDRVINNRIVQQWESSTTIKCRTYMYCSCLYLILHLDHTPLKATSILTDWNNECIPSGGNDQPALNKALSRSRGMHSTFHCDEFPSGNRADNKDWLNHFNIHQDIYLLHANWRSRPQKRQWFMDHDVWFVNSTVSRILDMINASLGTEF
eukprot:214401_1